MKKTLLVILAALAACSQTPPPAEAPAPQPVAAPEPPPVHQEAPRAAGALTFIAGSDIAAALEGSGDLARRDAANDIARRCGATGKKGHADAAKFEEIKAEPLKIGAIPERLRTGAMAELVQQTQIWQQDSPTLDFYKILSDGNPNGLKFDAPAAACIRYSLYRPGSPELYSDMIFSVTHNPKTPEILTVMPVRLYFRQAPAAIKITLGLRTFSLERTSGRAAAAMQNQEMAVEMFDTPGQPVYQLYDPATVPMANIPLPPWDFTPASINPRHNLSVFGITVTEIANFDWLVSHTHDLWPSWEYEATDIAKFRAGAQVYAKAHMAVR